MRTLLQDKKMLFVSAVLIAALLTVGVFAATTGTGALPINSGSTAAGGGVADVIPISDTFTIFQGNSQKISGVELYKVDLGSSTYRDQVKLFIYLLDPENMGAVLSNPHSFIEIHVAYEVNSGEDYTLDAGTKVKVATLRESVDTHLTRQNGEILLLPTMGGDSIDTDTYYLLGSITVPGGIPPGQQIQINSLRIVCEARL